MARDIWSCFFAGGFRTLVYPREIWIKKGTFMALRTQMGETQPGFPQKVHKPRTKFFLYRYLGKT